MIKPVLELLAPELILAAAACALILLGAVNKTVVRRMAPMIAVAGLLAAIAAVVVAIPDVPSSLSVTFADAHNTVRIYNFANYIRVITPGVGILLVLLCWPSNRDATGGPSVHYGQDGGEFFGLMLLAITGVMLVSAANDIILLFLAVELASIPGYILVSMSRPHAVAQESAVKYFFLGALSAALLLFGLSYLYGATGTTQLIGATPDAPGMVQKLLAHERVLGAWEMLGVLLVLLGLCFKVAAVPLHFYIADVYQGAATPVTAFLAFVPKTSGMVAIVKVLFAVGGTLWAVPSSIAKLIWILAVLTMTVGNVLALVQQQNVKRVLAWSSVAHSGYMLVGIATMLLNAHHSIATPLGQAAAVNDPVLHPLRGVLFYLPVYGVMTLGAFAVLMLLPARHNSRSADAPAQPGMMAETFDDLAGTGRKHVGLGLAMAVFCFSLTGLPLTAGFFGKFYLISPALEAAQAGGANQSALLWLVIILVINAAISAGYYLRIVAAMFLRAEGANGSHGSPEAASPAVRTPGLVVRASLIVAVFITLAAGVAMPLIEKLMTEPVREAARIEKELPLPLATSASTRPSR